MSLQSPSRFSKYYSHTIPICNEKSQGRERERNGNRKIVETQMTSTLTTHTATHTDTHSNIVCVTNMWRNRQGQHCKWIGLKKVVCKTQTTRPPFPPQLTAIKIAAAATRQQQQQEPPSMGGERKKAKLLKFHSKFLALGKTKCTRRGERTQGKAPLLAHMHSRVSLPKENINSEAARHASRPKERQRECEREGGRELGRKHETIPKCSLISLVSSNCLTECDEKSLGELANW